MGLILDFLELKTGEQLFVVKVRFFENEKFKIKTLIIASRTKTNAIHKVLNSKELGKHKIILSIENKN